MSTKYKILLIDDESAITLMVKSRLETNGYDVIIAHSGEEGIEKIKSDNPDLVVLDVMMAGMNGYQTCVTIKMDPALDRPVIILSARNRGSDKQLVKVCKADAHIHKPLSSIMLLPEIKRLLNETSMNVQP